MFRGSEVLKVAVVGDDKNNMLGVLEVGAPLLKRCKDRQEFFVIYFIVELRRMH